MIVLSCSDIQKSFGGETVLEGISLALSDRQRLGLVGPNGVGKTTLLHILTGALQPDDGRVSRSGALTIGLLAQEDRLDGPATVWDTLKAVFEPVFAMERRMREIEVEMGIVHERDPVTYQRLSREYTRLTDEFEDADSYGWRSAITGVLRGLGLPESLENQAVGTLSGGQRSRLSLARLLLLKPDVLLLDEPTNHLDLAAVSWLEATLKTWNGTVIAVSHDRWFLDTVCDSIAEMSFGHVKVYPGNFSHYLIAREAYYQEELRAYETNQREIDRHKAIITRYRAWGQAKEFLVVISHAKIANAQHFAAAPPSGIQPEV